MGKAITTFPAYINGWEITSQSHTHTTKAGSRYKVYNCICPYCKQPHKKRTSNMKINKSCGCVSAQLKRDAMLSHGDSYTRLYSEWQEMKRRSADTPERDTRFPTYAQKQIGVVEQWLDYSTFKSWALDNGYSDDLTLERRDNNLGYSPDNCYWADRTTQAQNQQVRSDSSTGYSGIGIKNGSYIARIQHKGKRHTLGRFDTLEAAVEARNNFILCYNTKHNLQTIVGD